MVGADSRVCYRIAASVSTEGDQGMGAGRLPEQIGDRAEAGRRAMLEDQTPDPLIEKLKATPVERRIVPEEKNRRRAVSAKAGPSKGAKAKAKASALRSALQEVWSLQAEIARLNKEHQMRLRQIEVLQKEVQRQRDEIARLKGQQ